MLTTMLTAGAAAVRRRAGTLAAVFGIELAFTLAFTTGAALALSAQFGDHRLFDRGASGHLPSLLSALRDRPGAMDWVLMFGLAMACLWWLVSLLLTGGLLTALADREPRTRREAARHFAAACVERFGGLFRLWLWSLLVWAPTLIALAVGAAAGGKGLGSTLTLGDLLARLLPALAPGLLLFLFARGAVDYGRVLLVADPTLPSRRALWRGMKLMVTRPAAPLHMLVYLAAWLAIGVLYTALSWGDFAGPAGAFGLFLVRQSTAALRLALRAAAWAGQQRLVSAD